MIFTPLQVFKLGLSFEMFFYLISLNWLFFACQWEEHHSGIYRTSQYNLGLTEAGVFLIVLMLV